MSVICVCKFEDKHYPIQSYPVLSWHLGMSVSDSSDSGGAAGILKTFVTRLVRSNSAVKVWTNCNNRDCRDVNLSILLYKLRGCYINLTSLYCLLLVWEVMGHSWWCNNWLFTNLMIWAMVLTSLQGELSQILFIMSHLAGEIISLDRLTWQNWSAKNLQGRND